MVERISPTRFGSSVVAPVSFAALLSAAGFLVVLAGPVSAFAGSTSVRYSYEQVEVGDRVQWVVVPRPEEKLRGEPTTDKIRTAFEVLRDEKNTSYGDTTLEIDGGSVEAAEVRVHIDPDHSKYKLIIMAETVYTLTELGVDDIRFPGYAEGNVTRADIPFAAYTPTLPLWRALPPGELVDARVRMPDGEMLALGELERRWRRGDGQLREALYSYLDADQTYTVVSVMERLPELDVSYTDKVVPLLEHESLSVRKTALEVLQNKRNRQEVLEAVVALMQNGSSDDLTRNAATFLGKADSEKYSVYEQFFFLQHGDEKERMEAAEALASYEGDPRVVEKLATALREHGDHPEVASRAARSLLELDAYAPLSDALQDDGVPADVRLEIARGLTEESDASAKVDGHRYLGQHAEGREPLVAIRALGDVGTAKARNAVESFLTSEDRRKRLAAAETVQGIGSTESLPALADAVREEKSAKRMEDVGVAILESKSVQDVVEFVRASDAVVQRAAYRALGTKAREGAGGDAVEKALQRGAESSDPDIRGAAVRGLGQLANDEALATLKELADDSAAVVRRDVAYALGNYSPGTMSDKLLSYLEDDSPEVVAAALAAIVQRGEAKKWERIKELADANAAVVRKNALVALASLVSKDDDAAVKEVISLISGTITSDNDASVLRTGVEQLGTFQRERAVNSIAIKLNAKDKEMQLAAIRALGNTGHETAVDLLTDKLNASNPEIRRATVVALGTLGKATARPALENRIENEENQQIRALIEKTLQDL